MSDLATTQPPGKIVRKPANVYYFRPYNFYYVALFIFVGAFACSALTETLNRTASILLWVAYLVAVLPLMAIDPLCVLQLKRTDENGNPVVVRRPLLGFRSCEQIISLDEIEQGLVGTEGDGQDLRLCDGFRYRPAFLRI